MKKSHDHVEWLKKADSDLMTLENALKVDAVAMADTICFLSQQATEKYLKALLVARGWALKKTHDLEALLAEAVRYESSLKSFEDCLKKLNEKASEFRYPADDADEIDEADASNCAQTARDFAVEIKKLMSGNQA